jgi:hypothetical protein
MKRIILLTAVSFILLGCAPPQTPQATPQVIYVTATPRVVEITTTPRVVEVTATPEPTALPPTPTSEPAGDGISFIDSGQRLGSAHRWDVALGDLDGDGDLDVFTANDSPEGNKIWVNDGQGIFTMSEQTLEPCLRVALGDLDGDSDLDAVVTNWDTEKDNWLSDASVWLNDGTGNFSKNQENLGGNEVFNLALGDLNGDGDLDIFFAAISANTVWLNDGNGSFTDTGQRLETGIDAAVVLGDLDQDGDLDALTGGWEGPAKVWLNDGVGNFVSNSQNMTGSNLHIHGLSLGDLDGDGDLDAFAALANGGPHKAWLNDGAGLFSQFQSLSAPLAHDISLGAILSGYRISASDESESYGIKMGFSLSNQPGCGVMRARCVLLQGHWKRQTRFDGASGAQREHYLG